MDALQNFERSGDRSTNLAEQIRSAKQIVFLVDRSERRLRAATRRLAAELAPGFAVASIKRRSGAGFADLIAECCASLDIAGNANPLSAFADFVSARMEEGHATALLFEGADAMTGDTLAKLAQLALLEENGERPLRVVLTGPPDLASRSDDLNLPPGSDGHAVVRLADSVSGAPSGALRLTVGGGIASAVVLAAVLAGRAPAPAPTPPLPAAVGVEQPAAISEGERDRPVRESHAATAAPALSELPEAPAKTGLAGLLARAERELSEGKLDSPESDNAFRTYQQIVLLAPDDPAGPHLLTVIRERIADQAREAEQREDADGGRRLRAASRTLEPEGSGLLPDTRPESQESTGSSAAPLR
jgi:hypothetical protein